MARPEPSPTAVVDQFEKAFPELATSQGPRGTASDQKRDRIYREYVRKLKRQGWKNVTVINLHRFPLDLNMGYLGHLTVPAKKEGTIYSKLVIDQPRIDMVDKGDANYDPSGVFPKEMAEDLMREYRETGGVFFYEGQGEIPEDLLDKALESQLKWHWALYNEATAYWNEKHNTRWISDRMRDAAKELVAKKLIANPPEWISVSRSESSDMPCDGCGVTIAKVARFCPTCNQIYDNQWVKSHRPDIWRKVNGPEPTVVGANAPNIDLLIEEQKKGIAPEGKLKSTQTT